MGAQKFKIRCSAIGKIITESREKSNSDKLADTINDIADTKAKIKACSEKALKTKSKLEQKLASLLAQKEEYEELIANGKDKTLSQTCKTYLNEWYVQHNFGRTKTFNSVQTDKGNEVENSAILLLSDLDNAFYVKNETHYENEYAKGTPDIVEQDDNGEPDLIIDVKSSFDLFTFYAAKLGELNQDYYWQLQGYMWLTGAKRAQLRYCAISTPHSIILRIIRKAIWEKGYLDPLTKEEEDQIWLNHNFDDIEPHLRVHTFYIDRCDSDIARITTRVVECREYLGIIWENKQIF